jgi:hypothetical protein
VVHVVCDPATLDPQRHDEAGDGHDSEDRGPHAAAQEPDDVLEVEVGARRLGVLEACHVAGSASARRACRGDERKVAAIITPAVTSISAVCAVVPLP